MHLDMMMIIRAMLLLLLAFFPLLASAVEYDYPTANPGSEWVNNKALKHSVAFTDGSLVRAILLRSPTYGTRYAFGFFCTDPSSFSPCEKNAYLLAVFILQTNSGGGIVLPASGFPRAVWYANRHRPVKEGAVFAFTSQGDLSLTDSDGTLVWSSKTSKKHAHSLSLELSGNLVLTNDQNRPIWQSFDHPVDILVLGQQLRSGMQLTSSTYFDNPKKGPYYLQMERARLGLYAQDPVTPQLYWSVAPYPAPTKAISTPYAEYRNGGLDLFISSSTKPDKTVPIPPTPAGSLSYLQLGADGKIRVYAWVSYKWTELVDLHAGSKKGCSIPSICGPYGVCYNGQCSCLQASSAKGYKPNDAFTPIKSLIPSLGCIPTPSLRTCDALKPRKNTHFLRLENFYYPNVLSLPSLRGSMSVDNCEKKCSDKCSCKAAFFLLMEPDKKRGLCFPVSKLYTITPNKPINIYWKSVALIRMQNSPRPPVCRN